MPSLHCFIKSADWFNLSRLIYCFCQLPHRGTFPQNRIITRDDCLDCLKWLKWVQLPNLSSLSLAAIVNWRAHARPVACIDTSSSIGESITSPGMPLIGKKCCHIVIYFINCVRLAQVPWYGLGARLSVCLDVWIDTVQPQYATLRQLLAVHGTKFN